MSAEGASIEAPHASRGGDWGGNVPLPNGEGPGEGAIPLPRFFLPQNGAFCVRFNA